MPGIEGSYSMVSMEMRRRDCVLRFLPGRVLLKGVAQRLRHGRQCYVTRSSRDIYCRNHVSICGYKDSWVRTMKCGIARVDNSGLAIVSSFLVAARLRARATATEPRTQLITADSDAEFVFPAKSQQGKIIRYCRKESYEG